jgi:hypothetical protein
MGIVGMRHIDLTRHSFFCDMRLLRILRCSGEGKPPQKLTSAQGGPEIRIQHLPDATRRLGLA